MARLWFAMISMVQRVSQKEHTISEMVSMIQPRELFANTMENSREILIKVKNSGPLRSADIKQESSRMIHILMVPRIRLSRR